ncbi:hypothetical protein R50073_34210 [Maricurvus nonylphenolicus]|uniref:hypothetical protein n=1 Tax=Maricurvus nonylphenolicus TaxID=1008307 RepID=UPI0036F31F52
MNKTIIDQEDILLALDQLTQTMEVMSRVVNRLKIDLEKLPNSISNSIPNSPPNTASKKSSKRDEKLSTTPQKVH